MTEPRPTSDAAAGGGRIPGLTETVNRIVEEIRHERLSPGEVAELRRLEPDRRGAAFWKTLAFHVETAGQQVGDDDGEKRWLLILRAVGELHGLHHRGRRLGRALAAAKVSEMRLARLLRSDLDGLAPQLRAVCHQLAAAGEPVDLADLAGLVVTAGRDAEDTNRRHIAFDFYRGLRQAADSSSDSNQEA